MPKATRQADARTLPDEDKPAMPSDRRSFLRGLTVLAATAAPIAASAAVTPVSPVESAELLALGERLMSLRAQRSIAVAEERATRSQFNAVAPLRPARSPRKYPYVCFDIVRKHRVAGGVAPAQLPNGRFEVLLSHVYVQSVAKGDGVLMGMVGG